MTRKRIDPEEAAARKTRIVELRRTRQPFDAIGREFGVTGQRAHQLYQEALRERPVAQVDEHRAEELELYDLATRRLMAIAVSTDARVTPRTQVEAWNAIRGYADSRRRLLGLDAPQQVHVTTADSDFDRAYAELTAALGGHDSVPGVVDGEPAPGP